MADNQGGFTCCVAQGNYGHRARKLTWLYYCGRTPPPDLDWSIPRSLTRIDVGFHSKEEWRRAVRTGVVQRLSHLQRLTTPEPFARLLIEIAEKAQHTPTGGRASQVSYWFNLSPARGPSGISFAKR